MTVLPTDSKDRKAIPIASGVLDYFPAALVEVARVSKAGNDKHNPGEPLHWSRGKSTDHADTIVRHLIDRGSIDPEDGLRHTAKVAWRALALLQEELEAAGSPMGRGSHFKTGALITPDELTNAEREDQERMLRERVEKKRMERSRVVRELQDLRDAEATLHGRPVPPLNWSTHRPRYHGKSLNDLAATEK